MTLLEKIITYLAIAVAIPMALGLIFFILICPLAMALSDLLK